MGKCRLLKDLVVLDALLQVLEVGVGAADRSHVGFEHLNVPFLETNREK